MCICFYWRSCLCFRYWRYCQNALNIEKIQHALVEFWRITLWRILPFLEDIAILGDLATLWSLDYHALVLVWRVFTLEKLGGLWRYTWRGHGGFVDDLVALIDDMEAWSMRSLSWLMTWRLGRCGAWCGVDRGAWSWMHVVDCYTYFSQVGSCTPWELDLSNPSWLDPREH